MNSWLLLMLILFCDMLNFSSSVAISSENRMNYETLNRDKSALKAGNIACNNFNYCDECGVTYKKPNLKIVGGIVATAHSWPAQVYIRMIYDNYVYLNDTHTYYHVNEEYYCGGTLINRDTVLSAAHCIKTDVEFTAYGNDYQLNNVPVDPSMYKIYLGVQNINEKNLIKNVRLAIRHPGYDGNLNDIAIFRLSEAVVLNEKIQIACLPDPGTATFPTNYGAAIYAAGWGLIKEDGDETSSILRNVKLTLYSPSKCNSVSPDLPKDWSTQLCVGWWPGGKDTCSGDSGTAIYLKNKVKNVDKYVAVGITSYGDGCAEMHKPGIYTMISAFLPWINQTIFSTNSF